MCGQMIRSPYPAMSMGH
uniref:Uncharacterized protein n=1 Tax=Arundo donax TaxID=35708 RepID=A0A0A8ZZM7_ARUDO